MDIRVLTVETHLAGHVFPGVRNDIIVFMEKVLLSIIATVKCHLVNNELCFYPFQRKRRPPPGWLPPHPLGTPRYKRWKKVLGDLFVRNDVPLVEETGDPLVENRAVHDELTEDETEEQVWLQRNEFLTECKSGRIVNKLTRNTRQKHSTG